MEKVHSLLKPINELTYLSVLDLLVSGLISLHSPASNAQSKRKADSTKDESLSTRFCTSYRSQGLQTAIQEVILPEVKGRPRIDSTGLESVLKACPVAQDPATQTCLKRLREFLRPESEDSANPANDPSTAKLPSILETAEAKQILSGAGSLETLEALLQKNEHLSPEKACIPFRFNATQQAVPGHCPGEAKDLRTFSQERLMLVCQKPDGVTWASVALPTNQKSSAVYGASVSVVEEVKNGSNVISHYGDYTACTSADSQIALHRKTEKQRCTLCHDNGVNAPRGQLVRDRDFQNFVRAKALKFHDVKYVNRLGEIRGQLVTGRPVGAWLEGAEEQKLRSDRFLQSCSTTRGTDLKKVRAAMNCTKCHNSGKYGDVGYPIEMALHSMSDKVFKAIDNGDMPPELGKKLSREERLHLIECLSFEKDRDRGNWLIEECSKKSSINAPPPARPGRL